MLVGYPFDISMKKDAEISSDQYTGAGNSA
jgi:hypothetical protein